MMEGIQHLAEIAIRPAVIVSMAGNLLALGVRAGAVLNELP